jgi:hypothetical protein
MMGVPEFAMLLSAQAPVYRLPPELLVKARALSRLETLLYFGGTAWQLLALFLLLRRRGDCELGAAAYAAAWRRSVCGAAAS